MLSTYLSCVLSNVFYKRILSRVKENEIVATASVVSAKLKGNPFPQGSPQIYLFIQFKFELQSMLTVNSLLTDTSVKRTPRVGPCLSLLPLFDSL